MQQQDKKASEISEALNASAMMIYRFVKMESFAGILVMLSAVMAMVIANSPLGDGYRELLETYLSISFGDIGLKKSLLHWINDGLMAIFFLLVGLEIKRELVEGELSSRQKAMLPFFAAIGGMAVPAIIFAFINWGNPETIRGWAIPSATDIAFALGVLSLLGSRVPLSLKVFLTAVAVIDDLGAVIVIALFYTAHISMASLAIAVTCFAGLLALNLKGVSKVSPYVVLGLIMWLAVLESGVHATIAGVVLGFTVPLKVKLPNGKSMLKYMEHGLHSWVVYLVLPIFSFANAGLDFTGLTFQNLLDPVPMGIAMGLFFGKQIGVFMTCALLVAMRVAQLPERATWMQFYGVCTLCGIGFTMSLFIGSLSYSSHLLLTETRLGVILGSVMSGILGYTLLAICARRKSTKERLANANAQAQE